MDFVTKRNLFCTSHACSPFTSPMASTNHPSVVVNHSSANFSIIAIVAIGIVATSFFLLSYYMFVIKCCFSLHHVDLLRRVSLSWRREETPASYSLASEPRGLEEVAIRLIPVIHYKRGESGGGFSERSFCECAVCLNEFKEDEMLRIIPNCGHLFHIDCIDVWLQSNANCPLCRRSISFTSQESCVVEQLLITPRPSPQDQSPHVETEDFAVVDLGNEDDHDIGQTLEFPTCANEHTIVHEKARNLHKLNSMGDECIGVIGKDESLLVQSIRRSFSLDSYGNRQFNLAVHDLNAVSSIEVCGGCSYGSKRSFFSFGHGSRSRSAVLPVYLDP